MIYQQGKEFNLKFKTIFNGLLDAASISLLWLFYHAIS